MITFDEGLIRTWRFPRFSALTMLFKQSLRTDTRTMMKRSVEGEKAMHRRADNAGQRLTLCFLRGKLTIKSVARTNDSRSHFPDVNQRVSVLYISED